MPGSVPELEVLGERGAVSCSLLDPTAPVRVSDVASVQLTGREQTQITRVNGHTGVLFRLSAQTGANATDVSDGVNRLIPQLQAQLPPAAKLVTVGPCQTRACCSICTMPSVRMTFVAK